VTAAVVLAVVLVLQVAVVAVLGEKKELTV
jgi:hypothetical protein